MFEEFNVLPLCQQFLENFILLLLAEHVCEFIFNLWVSLNVELLLH